MAVEGEKRKKKNQARSNLEIRHNWNVLQNCTRQLDNNIRIKSYLCPTCRQSWYYPSHFFTSRSH